MVTLSIDIISTEDEPAVTFSADCLEEYRNQVRCLSGDKSWEGALMANQPKTLRTRTPTPTGPTPTRTRTPVPNPTRTLTPTRTATLLPGTDPYQVFLGEPQSGIVIQPGQLVTASGLNQPFQPNAITLARTTGLGPVGPFWYHNWGHATRAPQGPIGLDIQFSVIGPQAGGYACLVNGTLYSGTLS